MTRLILQADFTTWQSRQHTSAEHRLRRERGQHHTSCWGEVEL